MNPEAKALWLAALRSGDYKQAQGNLAAINTREGTIGFCCLGVLCDVAMRNGVDVEARYVPGSHGGLITYNSSVGVLPGAVQDWAGLSVPNPTLSDGEISTAAAIWNDGYDASFEKIADLIEASL